MGRGGLARPLVAGQAIGASGYLALFFILPDAPLWLLISLSAPTGIGIGITAPSMTMALLDSTRAELAGVASGVLNPARQIGSVLGTALFGSLLAGDHGIGHGVRISTLIAFILTAITCFTSYLCIRPNPTVTMPGNTVSSKQ